jgi:hypothetical protein
MRKCMIEGCTRESYSNPITGESNILCLSHLKQVQKPKSNKPKISNTQKTTFNKPPKKSIDKSKLNNKQKNYNQTGKPSVQLFVLRGHTLTINYTGKTKHINVNRLTRAVKYNADKEGTSGKMFHYVIDVKQGIEVVANILFDNKAEREREFAKLQALLSKL